MAAASEAGNRPAVVIRPTRGWPAPDLGAVWSRRELVYFFAWRDVKVRYKQSAFGIAWAVLQPLVFVLIFTLLFSRGASLPHGDLPYPLFAYSGMLMWTVFSGSLGRSTASVVANQFIVSRVYFPRLVLPIAAAATALVDFAVASLVLVGMLIAYDEGVSLGILALPLFALLALATGLAFGLTLSALNVRFRDVGQALSLLTIVWLFATPVAYSSELLPERWRFVYELNPMVGVIEGTRWALFGGDAPVRPLLLSLAVVSVVLGVGLVVFRRLERTFADTV
jgi:lipopolysaccharide transport system permease protein